MFKAPSVAVVSRYRRTPTVYESPLTAIYRFFRQCGILKMASFLKKRGHEVGTNRNGCHWAGKEKFGEMFF